MHVKCFAALTAFCFIIAPVSAQETADPAANVTPQAVQSVISENQIDLESLRYKILTVLVHSKPT